MSESSLRDYSRHGNSQEDQIYWMELVPAVLGGLSLVRPGFSWSLRSRNQVIGKRSHVASETERTIQLQMSTNTEKTEILGHADVLSFFQSINTVILSQLKGFSETKKCRYCRDNLLWRTAQQQKCK